MSEGIKKYIMISSSILLVLINLAICWWLKTSWMFVLLFSYVAGVCNGVIIFGVENWEE